LAAAAAGTVAIVLGAAGAQAAAGDLDPSFGTGGVVLTDLNGSNDDFLRAVAIQKND
jgi:hypothetical protein